MAGTYDIRGEQALLSGANFSLTLTVKNSGTAVDNTGYTAYLKARKRHDSPTTVFSVSSADYISLLGSSGQVRVSIPQAITATYTPGLYVYDFSMLSATGKLEAYFGGRIEIKKLVSR